MVFSLVASETEIRIQENETITLDLFNIFSFLACKLNSDNIFDLLIISVVK